MCLSFISATFHAKDPSTSKEMALVEYTPPSIGYTSSHAPPSQGLLHITPSFFFVIYILLKSFYCLLRILINDYIDA